MNLRERKEGENGKVDWTVTMEKDEESGFLKHVLGFDKPEMGFNEPKKKRKYAWTDAMRTAQAERMRERFHSAKGQEIKKILGRPPGSHNREPPKNAKWKYNKLKPTGGY